MEKTFDQENITGLLEEGVVVILKKKAITSYHPKETEPLFHHTECS
jgi:hypothetical protein